MSAQCCSSVVFCGIRARFGSDACFEVVYVCERHGEVWKLDIPNGGLPVHSGGM